MLRMSTALLLFPVACAQTPGAHLGDFDVTQNLLENSCGPGALPAPDPLVFRAELREDKTSVFWRYETREQYVSGSESNGRLIFSMQTSMEQPIELSDGSMVTCRLNQLESLELETTDELQTFTGSNKILLAGANAECTYLTQSAGGPFLALPCEVSYDVAATRIEDESGPAGESDEATTSDASK